MQDRITCTGCYRHLEHGDHGILLVPVQYSKGPKSGSPTPYPEEFHDGRQAKWACLDCWDCWDPLEYAQQGLGNDLPTLPKNIDRVASLRVCAGCLGDMGTGCCGILISRAAAIFGLRSQRLRICAEVFPDGITTKVVCTDCWPYWEALEDGPGFPTDLDPLELLESRV